MKFNPKIIIYVPPHSFLFFRGAKELCCKKKKCCKKVTAAQVQLLRRLYLGVPKTDRNTFLNARIAGYNNQEPSPELDSDGECDLIYFSFLFFLLFLNI